MMTRVSALAPLVAFIVALTWLVPPALVPIAQAAVGTFSGHGSTTTAFFHLDAGLIIATYSHTGQHNFIVHAVDSTGQDEVFLVNEIGSVSGSTSDHAEFTGNYLLSIQADGDWTITIDQPHPSSAPPAPQNYSGHGQNVSSFVQLASGLITVRGTHTGQRNFIVHLVDLNGEVEEFIFNESGAFNGSKAFTLSNAGIYFVDVQADGDWTISVEQTGVGPTATPTKTPTPTRTPIGGIPTPTPTQTPTPSPTVTLTPQPVATCTPRPRVAVSTARLAPDQFQVSINASGANNQLRQLQFGAAANANITVAGQNGAGNFTVTLPPGTLDFAFTIRRSQPGQPIHVPFVVIDGCGPWPTFAGAGTGV